MRPEDEGQFAGGTGAWHGSQPAVLMLYTVDLVEKRVQMLKKRR